MTDQPETDLSKLTLEQLVGSAVPISVDRDYPGTREEIITDVVAALRAAGVAHPAPEEVLGYVLAKKVDGVWDVAPQPLPTVDTARQSLDAAGALLTAFGASEEQITKATEGVVVARLVKEG